MMQMHTWCAACGEITVVEFLEELPSWRRVRETMIEMHSRELTAARTAGNEAEAQLLNDKIATQQNDAELRANSLSELLAIRKTRQHCLRCGNVNIHLPTDDDDVDLPHHPCDGVLNWTGYLVGALFTEREPAVPHTYDADGELLRQGRMSSVTLKSGEPSDAPVARFYYGNSSAGSR